MGSIDAALRAGKKQNRMPMSVHTAKLRIMLHTGMLTGRLKLAQANVPAQPTIMPSMPPVTLIMMLSMRNWLLISMPRAPTDIRRPISVVRSVTLTSMMFIMPIPATISENAAATTRMMVMESIVLDMVSIISCWERIVKSSSSASFSLWRVRKMLVSSSMAWSVISSVRAEQLMDVKNVCANIRFITVV